MRTRFPALAPPSRHATVAVYGAAAIAMVALHLATNGVLGFHIDELYYLDSGRHPAFGYVDYPPVVPLLARLESDLLGVTPWALRLLPALLSGINVILCGAYVRKLGGALWLQACALLIGATAPAIVGTWLFQTVIFDEVAWMVSLYLFLSLVIEPRPRTWLSLGLMLGVGLEIKYTIAALIAGIGLAILITPLLREQLRTRYPWLGAGLALAIWLPNLAWQVANGLPTVTYVHNHSGDGPITFLVDFLLLVLLLTPLWITGFILLFRNRALRPVGVACAVPFAVFLVGGKFYYPAPTIPLVMAAGLIALSRLDRRLLRSALTISAITASLLGFVALVPITIPYTPADRLHASGLDTKVPDLANTVGWESITRQLTAIYDDLSPSQRASTVIVGSNYGIPGALAIYGDPNLLPASFSPQLSDFDWLPQHLAATDVLMVGYEPSDVVWMCTSASVVAHLTVPFDVASIEQGAPVTYCHLRAPLPTVWSQLRNFA